MKRLLMIAVLAGPSLAAWAQADPTIERGLKPYGSYQGGNIDSVSLTNGNLTIHIPVASYPQRGDKLSFTFFALYNNKGWQVFTSQLGQKVWQWKGAGVQVVRDQTLHMKETIIKGTAPDESTYFVHLWDGATAEGSSHHFAGSSLGAWESVDVTGIRFDSLSKIATDRAGVRYTGAVAGGKWLSNTEDPNGNKITEGTTGWTDTLGRFFAGFKPTDNNYGGANNGSANGGKLLPGAATTNFASCPTGTVSAHLWSVPAPSGGTASLKFCYQSFSLSTSFGSPGISEGSATDRFLTRIVLPNGTYWGFSYNTWGDLTTITLPIGGTISYTWTITDGSAETPKTRSVASRTVNANDGTGGKTWNYQWRVILPGPGWYNTIVTDPSSPTRNDAVHSHGGGYVLQERRYSGSYSSGALLKTVDTVYSGEWNPDGDFLSTGSGYGSMNVVPLSITTTLANGQVTKVEKTWDASETASFFDPIDPYGSPPTVTPLVVGSLLRQNDYDYAQGAPGPRLRRTDNAYLWQTDSTTKTNNLLDLVSSTIIRDAADARVAETDYAYDQTAVVSSGVTTQHNLPPSAGKRGNLTTTSRWLNTTGGLLSSTASYFDTGMVYQSKDPLLHTTTRSYSATFQGAYVTQSCNALSHCTGFNYDFNTGLQTSVTDPNNQTTTSAYDIMFRRTQQNAPDGGQVSFAYQDFSPFQVTVTSKITASVNAVSEGEVDGLGRVKQTRLLSDPEGAVYGDTTYDALGRTATATNPYRSLADPTYGITTTQYDALGRVTKVIPPDGTDATNNVSTVYAGNCATVTDQAAKKRKSCADALGRLTQVFEPDAAGSFVYETDYQYDTLDNLTRVDQKGNDPNSANWRTRTFTYNSLSQLLAASNPESGAINYTYDSDGNLLTKVAPAPNQTGTSTVTTTYGYDALHRLTGKTYSNGDPAVSYFYDQLAYNGLAMSNGKGRRTGMSDAAGMTAWSYDSEGRTITERRIMFGLGKTMYYTYNLDGSLASLRYPSSHTINYAYNAAARPLSAIDTANSINYATAATYAPHGALAGVKHGVTGSFTGIVTANTYNPRLQPVLLSAAAPSQTVLSFSYGFGLGTANNGNVLTIQNNIDAARTQTFTYDELNRVKTAEVPTAWGLSFGYDIWANLLSQTVTKGSAPMLNVAANTKNQIVGFTYDAAGNLSNDGAQSYTYDGENRLSAAAGVTYTYDGDGKRVRKSNGKLYWTGIGSDSLVESDLSGNVNKEFIFFGGKRIARIDITGGGAVRYFFSDHLGTSRIVTNATGTVLDDADFYPFGGERVVLSSSGNNYKFTGKERDSESGLDYFGARYYCSNMARFMTPDWSAEPVPVPYADLSDPQTLNLYGYVRNNPLSHADADGHCCAPSELADYIDTQVQTFRQDGLSVNNNASPAVAAINTFANGVTADLASGTADLLRVGNGTAAAIDSAKQGDYLGAAANLSQDGGRVGGIILIVAGGEAKAQGDANALGRQVDAQGAKGGNQSVPGSYPESTVNRAGQNFVDKNGPSQSLTGRQGSTTTGAKSTNPQTGQTNVFRNAQPKANTPGRTANFVTKPQPKGPNTSNVHVKIKE